MWHKPQLMNAIADLLMLIGMAAVLAAGTVWVVRVPALPIKQVSFVEPLAHTRRTEIEQVLAGPLRGNFFSVNLDVVRSALESLPWVRRAEVRRHWPARLEVRLEEHRPVAVWGEGRGELVNSYGEVFAAAMPEADGGAAMPVLFGPQGTAPEVLQTFGEMSEQLTPMQDRPVQLLLSSRLAWQAKLQSGLLIEMGRDQVKSPVATRLQRFVESWPGMRGKYSGQPLMVDLRYPNGFAMRVAEVGKGK